MKRVTQLPFMSVVISVYNGGAVLGRALESLLAQDYPRDRYEIIVVNDGSTDDTQAVASRYPVRVMRHERNLGIGAGRTTGLEAARGEIYVCFDDDCVVAADWLRQVAAGYAGPDVLGVGSVMAPPRQVHGWVDRFMVAAGSGNPPSLKLGASKSPLRRFVAYLADQLGLGGDANPTVPYRVRQLNGATASFPVAALRAVGGWDRSLAWMEDTDLCTRLGQAFPRKYFYAMPTARLVHDPKMSLATFMRRPYMRGGANLQYYRRNGLTPPVFPFPLAWLAGVVGIMALGGLVWGLAAAVLLPQLLYVWWPARAVHERGLWHVTFPYLQLAEEWSTIAGLVRGYVLLRKERRHA